MIHETADVQTKNIGLKTDVWQYSVILKGARIGNYCNINCHVFIENDVQIGDYVTVKAGVQLWDGIVLEDQVFVGPNTTFTNDKYPRSKQYPDQRPVTRICQGASIGAGAIIMGGSKIGKYAIVGAGSLVTKNVPARALVIGSPAKVIGWLNKDGSKMVTQDDYLIDNENVKWIVRDDELIKL